MSRRINPLFLPLSLRAVRGCLVLGLLVFSLSDNAIGGEKAATETTIRVALVQFDAVPGEAERNLDEMERLVREAAKGGARIIVFHEATLTDYTADLEKHAQAVPDGPAAKRLIALAGVLDCYISFGLSEKADERYHITQAFVGPEGLIHRYRKTWLWFDHTDGGYRNEWARYDPGQGPELFTIAGISAACIICADGVAARAVERLRLLGPQLVFYPNNRVSLPGFSQIGSMAATIGAPVLVTNRIGKSGDYPCIGGTVVYGGDGEVLAESNRSGREEILYHDLAVPARARPLISADEKQTADNAGKEVKVSGGIPGLEWVFSKAAKVFFSRSEVTVASYSACVDAGVCAQHNFRSKNERKWCNWGHDNRHDHPMNCINWNGAKQFCEWAGGRLPTDEEWMAEASAEGTQYYPWGNESATCERTVMDDGGNGCGKGHTWPVCSKEAGNSISGLCDLSGNVDEWTGSRYLPDETHPATEHSRVVRGGSWRYDNPIFVSAVPMLKYLSDARYSSGTMGFRGVKTAEGPGDAPSPQSSTPVTLRPK